MASYLPSDEDRNTYGSLLAGACFGTAILGGVLLAAQVYMVLVGLSAFIVTPKPKRKGRLRFIIMSLAILVTSSTNMGIDIWSQYRVLYAGGPTPWSYVESYHNDDWTNRVPIFISDVMLVASIAIGDVLMLWRCIILWKNQKWILLLPSLACIGTIGCNVMFLVWSEPFYPEKEPSRSAKANIAAVALSVITNVLVTVLILYRLILARARTARAFPDGQWGHHRTYTDATAIIVESSAPLALFGIVWITVRAVVMTHLPVNFVDQGRLLVADWVLFWLYYSFCALSPQMIIYRVTTGKSWKNAKESQGGAATISQSIRFACNGGESKVSDSTESE